MDCLSLCGERCYLGVPPSRPVGVHRGPSAARFSGSKAPRRTMEFRNPDRPPGFQFSDSHPAAFQSSLHLGCRHRGRRESRLSDPSARRSPSRPPGEDYGAPLTRIPGRASLKADSQVHARATRHCHQKSTACPAATPQPPRQSAPHPPRSAPRTSPVRSGFSLPLSHQVEGVASFLGRRHAILADDRGLTECATASSRWPRRHPSDRGLQLCRRV